MFDWMRLRGVGFELGQIICGILIPRFYEYDFPVQCGTVSERCMLVFEFLPTLRSFICSCRLWNGR